MTVVEDPPANGVEERPPDVALLPPAGQVAAAVGAVKCRYCEDTFPLARGGQLARGVHEKKEHRDEWQAAKEEAAQERANRGSARAKGQSSKKGRTTPRTSATRSGRGGRPTVKAPARRSAANLLGSAVGGLAWLIGRASNGPEMDWLGPVAAMVSFEAPIAGSELDAALADGLVDKVLLQRAVAAEDRFERVAPLVLLPMMVGAVAKNPALHDEAYPWIRRFMRPMLPAMLAEMVRDLEEEKAANEAAAQLADIDPVFAQLFAGGADPIDAILSRIFPPPPGRDAGATA